MQDLKPFGTLPSFLTETPLATALGMCQNLAFSEPGSGLPNRPVSQTPIEELDQVDLRLTTSNAPSTTCRTPYHTRCRDLFVQDLVG